MITCKMAEEAFDGMSLIKWSEHNQICYLQEFGCHREHYNPYEQGEIPQFREDKSTGSND